MAVYLAEELKAAGWEDDPEEFRTLIVDLFHGMYRGWTDEELSCHPLEAHQFCNLVRHRSRLPNLSDRLCMRCLINWRKSTRKGKPRASDGEHDGIDPAGIPAAKRQQKGKA